MNDTESAKRFEVSFLKALEDYWIEIEMDTYE